MIIIPMAGESSRFIKSGYTSPKFMLELNKKTVFEICLESFSAYFTNEFFVFVCKDDNYICEFVETKVKNLGIQNYAVKRISKKTRGQAETVLLGIKDVAEEEELYIFNIDTFRPDFEFPADTIVNCSGYLEVFRGEGDNWSFVLPEKGTNIVIKTAEKQQISNLCCTGLYYFNSIKLFKHAYNTFINDTDSVFVNDEVYVAPLYNVLINAKNYPPVRYKEVSRDSVIFCGVPAEYELLRSLEC